MLEVSGTKGYRKNVELKRREARLERASIDCIAKEQGYNEQKLFYDQGSNHIYFTTVALTQNVLDRVVRPICVLQRQKTRQCQSYLPF